MCPTLLYQTESWKGVAADTRGSWDDLLHDNYATPRLISDLIPLLLTLH